MNQRIAVYAGSFDPITNGHLDIMSRAVRLFDRLVVVVATNSAKKSLFPLGARETLVRGALAEADMSEMNVDLQVLPEGVLLVDFARKLGACAMIRGLRPVQDFPGEFSLASVNRRIHPEIETVMLVTDPKVAEVSSSMVKELAALNGPFEQFVPAVVAKAMKESRARSSVG